MAEYKISQSEKDEITKILQDIQNGTARINQILANAQIIQNGQTIVTTPKPETVVPAAPKPETAVAKERLTTNIVESLFGPYQNLRVYNNEEERLIYRDYKDIKPYWDIGYTRASQLLKKEFEEKFPEFEQVAQVTMQVPEESYPGDQKWSSEQIVVKFSAAGTCTVGNLIIRNKQTGKLERFNDTRWFGVSQHLTATAAAECGAYNLVYNINYTPNFLKNLFSGRNVR